MRNKGIHERASQPTSNYSVHTHEVVIHANGTHTTIRCYSEAGAELERQWQERQGYTAEVKSIR